MTNYIEMYQIAKERICRAISQLLLQDVKWDQQGHRTPHITGSISNPPFNEMVDSPFTRI